MTKVVEDALALGASGEVVHPNLHDGRLWGIYLRPHGAVDLFVSDEAGVEYQFRLGGVERFRANDFREGNIVLGVTMQAATEIRLRDVVDLCHDFPDKEEESRSIIKRAQEHNLNIFRIDPSYGCAMVALCCEVKVFRHKRIPS